MSHDTTKVLMGATNSNHKEVTNYDSVSGSPIAAGLAVIKESTGKISLDTSEGQLQGISLGKDLSDTAKTAVVRKGLGVPVQLKSGFNPTVGAAVAIEDDTGLARAYTGSGDRYVNASYASGRIGGSGVNGGITEDGSTCGAAYIDFPGGL